MEVEAFAFCNGRKAIFRQEFSRGHTACSHSSPTVQAQSLCFLLVPPSSPPRPGSQLLSPELKRGTRTIRGFLLRIFLTNDFLGEKNDPDFAIRSIYSYVKMHEITEYSL